MNKQKLTWFVLSVFFLIFSFTTCETPMGMGDSIDFEAPVLTITPVPNPWYVRNGAILTGTVTDNVAVDRVVMTDTTGGAVLFSAVTSGDSKNKTWEIALNFDESRNGEKIVAQITAYDTAGNSGAESIAFVTLIVDIRPPVIESMTIQRTDSRMTFFEPLDKLKGYETLDSKGERKDYVYNYQNGWFYIDGIVEDKETKVEIISLDIFDVTDPSHINIPLLNLQRIDTSSAYFPRWFIKEDDLIAAGVAQWGQSYYDNYYKNGDRYYYRVAIHASDKSNNESVDVMEEEGYFCMWEKSDDPKGILDPSIGDTVVRGTPLPVDFFDDDSLDWAYAGLLTRDQWNGVVSVDNESGKEIKIPDYGGNKDAILKWLKERLVDNGKGVYNWKYDKQGTTKGELITELIGPKKLDEKLVYILTGNSDTDYGDFVLFTISKDTKLPPHDGKGPENTNKDRWSGRAVEIQVIDENAPLIVFDTTKGTGGPEENTFPELTNGETFNIVGYTLRDNSTKEKENYVKIFRMAWIPYRMPGKADNYITKVQEALAKEKFTDVAASMPPGVQYWDFALSNDEGAGKLKDEGNIKIPDDKDLKPDESQGIYKKQSFKKRFSVLGGVDDINSDYKNFYYDGLLADGETPGQDGVADLENETKLFIFFAMDDMGHKVYRQLRLLGIKTPPKLTVYDITTRNPDKYGDLPDINSAIYDPLPGGINENYLSALKAYNERTDIKSDLKTDSEKASLGEKEETIPFQIYPRGSRLKYWVTAAKATDIAVANITMKDVTYKSFNDAPEIGSGYRASEQALSFVEYYPDVTQRTFLFEATDKLGNKASMQRTIAVTNAARLENITTTAQNGTYGPGSGVIPIKANFSSQIVLQGGNDVRLRVRYEKTGVSGYEYEELSCTNAVNTPTLSLDFNFTVKDGYKGKLETVYDNASFGATGERAFPIRYYGSTKIVDYLRIEEKDNEAFIPGYKSGSVNMPNWTDDTKTLQNNKTITLDGIKPKIISTVAGGKTINSDGSYYFRAGETITFTLEADKPISASATAPTLKYNILSSGSTNDGTSPNTDFIYQRPDGSNKVVFELKVTSGNGELVNVKTNLGVGGTFIQDNYGNTLDEFSLVPKNTSHIYIKTTPPDVPAATLAGSAISTSSASYFAAPPSLVISDSSNKYAGSVEWENGGKEYSLTGGNTWLTYSGSSATIIAGNHNLQVRYIDKAGNLGATLNKTIQVTSSFPKLQSVNTTQISGWYTSKTGSNNLTFNLNFERKVNITTPENVIIRLTNRAATNTPNSDGTKTGNQKIDGTFQSGTDESYQVTLIAKETLNNGTTVKFEWNNISGKEMRDGLYISSVNLAGLTDDYSNTGGSGIATYTAPAISMNSNAYTCPNLPWTSTASIKVDAIAPTYEIKNEDGNDLYKFDTSTGGGVLSDTHNRKIILKFKEPVMIGTGTITVKPRDDGVSNRYKIPAVLRNEGYYLGSDGKTEFTGPGENRTFIMGFYDIYNALTDSTDKQNLTESASSPPSMGNLALDERTGQSKGPYIKMTHGLKEGAGFTGSYSNDNPGKDGPVPSGSGYLIPDVSTKWVLDYRYSIDNANNTKYADTSNSLKEASTTVVPNIRTALTKAKWRWQEMNLVSSVSFSDGNKTVTITLNEPLLKGLQWTVEFLSGTFTDSAGNQAVATPSDCWFWSSGVQDPVIRVNRKSFDARTSNWESTSRVYSVPADLGNSGAEPGGWGINDFRYVHYRIESETPGASIYYATEEGKSATDGLGSIEVPSGWKGDLSGTGTTIRTWERPDAYRNGTNTYTNTTNVRSDGDWVKGNLVRRAGTSIGTTNNSYTTNGYYEVIENGVTTRRSLTASYAGYRSYNRDILKTTLEGKTLGSFSGYQSYFTFGNLEAAKNYVIAQARITHDGTTSNSNYGYEGVFRSVIALRQDSFGGYTGTNAANLGGARSMMVEGSNVKNGMPSIAGFPVYDAQERLDNRFIKLFCFVNMTNDSVYTSSSDGQLSSAGVYWVSTEIVSQWYFLGCGATHAETGDVNNYLYSGYGDLSYCYNFR